MTLYRNLIDKTCPIWELIASKCQLYHQPFDDEHFNQLHFQVHHTLLYSLLSFIAK